MTGSQSCRCVILAVGDFPEGGATSQRLLLLARILAGGRFDCEVLLLHPASKSPVPGNDSLAGETDGIRFRYLSGRLVRPGGLVSALLDTVTGIFRSVRVILQARSRRPDCIVFYTPRFVKFIVPLLAARLAGIHVFFEVCEVRSKSTDRQGANPLRRILARSDRIMERLTPHFADGLIVISDAIRKYCLQSGQNPDDVCLLPVLVDCDLYARDPQRLPEYLVSSRYLVNSGSFNEKDGVYFLVDAVSRVREKYPDIRLVFTGSASRDIRQRITAHAGDGAENWILFTGFLSRDELISCYRNAAGLLSCRSNSDYANYGFSTKIAEYLATGRPVVITRVGDAERYLTDGVNAYFAEPEDAGSIGAAILRLLDDPQQADRTGLAGRQVARECFDYRVHIGPVSRFVAARTGPDNAC